MHPTLQLLDPHAARSPHGLQLKLMGMPWWCSACPFSPPHPCLCLDLRLSPHTFPLGSYPFVQRECTITPLSLYRIFWLDLTLDRWMNVTPWQKSCQYAVSTEKGAQEHLSRMELDVLCDKHLSECMCLLLLGFGYWAFWDLAIAFILIYNIL